MTARSTRSAWFSAGTIASLLAAASWLAVPARGQDSGSPADRASTTVVVEIALPEKAALPIGVAVAEGSIRLELPQGASVPLDLEASGQGLLRGGELQRLPSGRLLLDLKLAGGLLDRVDVEHDKVRVTLRSRVAAIDRPASRSSDAYRLGPGDKILITVAGQPDQTTQTTVSPNGAITVPFIGEYAAGGRTVGELTMSLADRLARDILVDPQLNIQVLEYRSQWVVVSGEVRTPGRLPLRGGTDLKEAIAESGGLGPAAGTTITIARKLEGKDGIETIRVNREAFERGEENLALRHGDVVQVSRVAFCYVRGEVRAPGKFAIEEGLTLLRALSLAGDLTEWANRKNVQILEEGEAAKPVSFDLRDIESGKIPDPVLRGGEVIIVKRRFL